MYETLAISEIFYSFQGESSYIGMPTVFIRCFGCNLNCSICDTKYSFKGAKKNLQITEIIKIVNKVKTPYICITGGEPLVQKPLILKLSKELLKLNKIVSIETNGSIDISGFNKKIKIVMDIKTPSSFKNFKVSNLFLKTNLKYLKKSDELKFVISNKSDYNFAVTFIKKHKLKSKVIFSPNLKLKKLANNLIAWILKDKLTVMFQPQLHKLIKEEPIYLL